MVYIDNQPTDFINCPWLINKIVHYYDQQNFFKNEKKNDTQFILTKRKWFITWLVLVHDVTIMTLSSVNTTFYYVRVELNTKVYCIITIV